MTNLKRSDYRFFFKHAVYLKISHTGESYKKFNV
jgi:hypothetical protein